MKKFIIFTLSLLVIFASTVYSGTVEDALKKVIKAQGGEKLKTIKSTYMTGKLKVIAQGLEGTISISSKYPGKTRSDVSVMGMNIVRSTDGKIGWSDNPMAGGVKQLSKKQALSQIRGAIGYDALFNPEKYGIKYELAGKETVDGKEYFVIKKSYKDGQNSKMYYDTKTHLPMISKSTRETAQGSMKMKLVFSNYKKVDGIMTAHNMSQFGNGQKTVEIIFEKVEYNKKIDDKIFLMPEVKKAEEKK